MSLWRQTIPPWAPLFWQKWVSVIKLYRYIKKEKTYIVALQLDVFGFDGVSANEKDEIIIWKFSNLNIGKNEGVALAVVYGAGAGRLSHIHEVQ